MTKEARCGRIPFAGGVFRGLQKAQGDTRVERSLIMDDISEFLLGSQRGASSTVSIVLTVIVVALAVALMLYLLHCYVRERQIRMRVARRVHQPYGGNIVPPEAIGSRELSETKRLRRKSSRVLPLPHCDRSVVKVRRVCRLHPWKQNHLRTDSPTPH